MKALHKVLIAIVLSMTAVFLSVGFANTTVDIEVSGTANILPPQAVYITSVTVNSTSGTATADEGTAPIKTYSGWFGSGSFDTDEWKSTDNKTIEQKIASIKA